MSVLVGPLTAGLVTLLLCPLAITALTRHAVIDSPGARSSHSQPTPRGGGLAPALGACIGLVLTIPTASWILVVVVGVAVAFGVLGFIDDVGDLAAGPRLLVQLAIAAVAALPLAWQVAANVAVVLLIPVVWVWLVAYVNAFNFMDGINGISSIQVIVAGIAWGVIGIWKDEPALTAGGFVVAAAALAFLPFNAPQARVFLGDVGSYFFGGWLASLAVVALGRAATLEMALAPLLLYLCDTGVTLSRRVARRVRFTEAHREHVYQRLVIGGWSHSHTTMFVGGVLVLSCALGALTMLDRRALRIGADLTLVLLMLCYVAAPWGQIRWSARDRRTS